MKAKFKPGSFLFVVCVVLTLVICIFGFHARLTGVPLTVAGYGLTKVMSPSMEPTMMTGAYAVFKTVNSVDDFQVGDIVVFRNPDFGRGEGTLYCHRVTSVNSNWIATKGDNNDSADPFTTPVGDVVGVVVGVWNGVGQVRPGTIIFSFVMMPFIAMTVVDMYKKRKDASLNKKPA